MLEAGYPDSINVIRCKAVSLLVLLLTGATALCADRVETIDLRTVVGSVASIGPKGVQLSADGNEHVLPLADVEAVFLREAEGLMTRGGQSVIVTVAGDTLAADEVRVADGKIRFESPAVGSLELSLKVVGFVYLPRRGEEPGAVIRKCLSIKRAAEATDDLIVDRGKEWSAVQGILLALRDGKITFRLRDEDRQIDTRHVKAIRLAIPHGQWTPAGSLIAADGSEILFSSLKLQGEELAVESRSMGALKIARRNVASIRFVSERVVPLADLKPASVEEHGLFDAKFPHRLNKSVGGGPIRLKGLTYSSGIGLNSYSQLTYRLDGKYTRFVALAGIDDAVRPAGNATLSFLADDKPLGRPIHLTGKDDPVGVNLDLTGAKTFTIRVDFGRDELPVGDHVDLASARLIK
ncbi:MAG TPA: NPCBM/NEW2 domain-containing protein [Phycisphaerae bacterium]|nr:NPCBM/NEW2 domain-containing protein [Phycisphaerae bacterium]